MRKFSSIILLILVFLIAAAYFNAPFRETLRLHLPTALQQFLPAANGGGTAGINATDPSEKSNPKTIALGSGGKASAAIAVAIAAAATTDLPIVERTYGIVTSFAVVAVNAQISSQIIEVHVKDGQLVKAGDLLVSLDDRLQQAQLAKDQAVLAKDQALEVNLEADKLRARDLAAKGAGTTQAYEQAMAAQKGGQGTMGADRAALAYDQAQLAYTKIAAPISGRLGAVSAVVGNLVGSGSSGGASSNLMTITQLQPLKVAFKLPERLLSDMRKNLQAGQVMPVRVFQSGTTTELESGNLDFIDSAIDTTSGTIAMSTTIDNDQLDLWPGQFVDVEVQRETLANAVVIPTVAIQQGQAGSFVWLVKDDGTVAATAVTVAQSESDRSAISAGLAAGDKVVVEGQLKLKDGIKVKSGVVPVNADAAAQTPAQTKQEP
jgi:multidrug efflux system membrane fusion protein